MIDVLKKLDKKFLIMAGCIIFLPIFLIIIIAIIQGCNRTITYDKYEEKMISATEKYISDKNIQPIEEGETVSVKLNELVDSKYIKSSEKLLNDNTCEGKVTVRRNGASVDTNDGGYLNYLVTLNCKEYSTPHLIDKLKEDVVSEGSGLYVYGDGYIFKGDKPHNYITFFGKKYRIVSIDKNGILKLLKEEPEITSRVWDNKYNTEVNYTYGKNIYKDSKILSYLLEDYKNVKKISTKAKAHVVAYDTCIGKRDYNDYSINKGIDCSEVLEKQVISLINVSDLALASTDPECNSVKSKSCRNYNYMYRIASSTWTSNTPSNNSYEVFYISSGLLEHQNANRYNEYNIIIYIDGSEIYKEGKGTFEEPYIIN